ncbi:MAG: M1 family metallopeptidase [Bacteroidota bacterium]|nr:M1 family metallopeptidase [Bacteroidota bacterium]MDP4248330.1 M1 family metallopeptidase [Bacteroidota bacterium]MDP4258777.1 M1 family metallopeptidase [Bacteroidota bacterium]
MRRFIHSGAGRVHPFAALSAGLLAGLTLVSLTAAAQPDRWQQRVKYAMDVDMDVSTNRFTGKQVLAYTNNSPDTLRKVFYHLYWNAFQPGSMMDTHSRELGKISYGSRGGREQLDWDTRVMDRIEHLKPDEIGYQKVLSLTMNGVPQPYQVEETILEVPLTRPILPHTTVTFAMSFEAQVPLQIRRSGRDNPQTGVRYSMSQWYPKICEYDYAGWHPTPYVAREFYGVWGDYDVRIHIDKSYMIGGTGYLQNPSQTGFGYEGPEVRVVRPAGNKLLWHFVAPNVHDFMWAADPDYKHLIRHIPGGPEIHVLYKNKDNDPRQDTLWNALADAAVIVLPYIEANFGKYPYKQYSFIHGGDGGMEYPMSTLLVGPGLGGAFHEWMHSWYQGMLGTNESMYAWMDEGFTSYATDLVENYYYHVMIARQPGNSGLRKMLDQQEKDLPAIHAPAYNSYFSLLKSRLEEPLTTHADHFNTNYAYGVASYSKGDMFLEQLGYITGASTRDRILQEYYRLWRFKHPNADDFVRVAEKVSGMKLDWYQEFWVSTTKTIDYGIDSLWEQAGKTRIRLRMIGKMPMPIDVSLQFRDGSKLLAYIPQYLMFGEKPVEEASIPRKTFEPWKWTSPTYEFEIDHRLTDLKIVEIDASQRMADVDRTNNKLELQW